VQIQVGQGGGDHLAPLVVNRVVQKCYRQVDPVSSHR
jgi:hypothetical protein